MQGLRPIFVLLLLVGIVAMPAFSQAVNATIVGTVTDISGGIMPNAKVTITEANTGVSHSGVTNESGFYTFADLPPGTYSVTVEQTGFKKETRADIIVQVNSTVRADIKLTP